MALTNTEKLRIYIGDTTDPPVFTDVELEAFLLDNNDNVAVTAQELRPLMGVRLASTQTREREGNVEVYGGDKAKNYLTYLKYFEDSGSGSLSTPTVVPLFGGVSKSKNTLVDDSSDSVSGGVQIGMLSSDLSKLFS